MTLTNTHDQDVDQLVVESITKAIVDAYYPDRVRIANTARSRAQAAQSVVTAVAGAVVAGFTLSTLASYGMVTRVISCVAVALWLAASVLYVIAIAVPAVPESQADEAPDARAMIRMILTRAKAEAKVVDRRQRTANIVAGTALGMTVLAFAIGVLGPAPAHEGTVHLTPDGVRLLQVACTPTATTLRGRVDEASLSAQFVKVVVDPGTCEEHEERELLIPRAAVVLVESET